MAFTPNWHLHNAFSMGRLVHFTEVVCGPITAVHSSNDVSWPLRSPEYQKRVMWAWTGSGGPINFLALNANSSKMAAVMDSKVGKYVCRGKGFIEFAKRGRGEGHVTPIMYCC